MRRVVIALALLSLLGCGASPASPSQPTVIHLGLAGQSNSMFLAPALRQVASVDAFYGEVTTIAPCWDVAGSCWLTLRPQLSTRLDAFVWWQGESDVNPTPIATYAQRQTDLVSRVRAVNGNARLLVVVLQMGPYYDGTVYQTFKRDWAATDVNAVYLETQGLGYQDDGIHMTPNGYAAVAHQIAAAVRGRR